MLLVAAPAAAQQVDGWKVHRTAHVSVYTVPGAPGARDAERVAAQLEELYREVIAPLGLPPVRLLYPLYPSIERFYADWWRFATLGYGDLVHTWGAVYAGDAALNPYPLTRAVVDRALPRAIPLLRWGLGDALGDLAAGVDAHRHVRALVAASQRMPPILEIAAPSDFGNALPTSYPVAVSFMAYLLETYGPAKTAGFATRVEYRYYDIAGLFQSTFGEGLEGAEAAWRARAGRGSPEPLDLRTYGGVTRFVYRTTLAGSPARLMLEPHGAVVVTEALRAIPPLRRLDVRAAAAHVAAAQRADEEADRRFRRRTTAARGAIALVIAAPIVLAVGWLLWPSIRARLYAERKRRAVRRQA